MAGELTTTITFADGDQVTSAKLNQIISGGSFTTAAVTGTTLTVTGGKLKVGTITSSELGASCVTATALAANAVISTKILDGNITTAKIATSAVTTEKIANDSITAAKLAPAIEATSAVMKAETTGYVVMPDDVKYSRRVAKAHGCISVGASSRAILGTAVNVDSVTRESATATRVDFATNMADENYTVLATWEVSGATADPSPPAVSIYDKTASKFIVSHADDTTGDRLNFVVFGDY